MTYGGCCLRYPAWRCSNLNLRTALPTPQTMPTVELRHESSHLAGNFATGNGERAIDVNAQMRGFAGMVSCWRSLLVVPLVGGKMAKNPPSQHHDKKHGIDLYTSYGGSSHQNEYPGDLFTYASSMPSIYIPNRIF